MHIRRRLLQLDLQNSLCCSEDDSVKFELGFRILLAIRHVDKDRKTKLELYYGDYDDNFCCSKFKKINYPLCTTTHDSVIGSCNGLVCMTGNLHDHVHIFNPLTGEHIDLPRFEQHCDPSNKVNVGFGYASSKDEYKVVRIIYPGFMVRGQVQVYTLGDGNGWRDKGEINYELFPWSGVFANGAIYWLHLQRQKIVSFDLEDEVFRCFPLPPLLSSADYLTKLASLGGCISLVQGYNPEPAQQIWLLRQKRNGAKTIWIWEYFGFVSSSYEYEPIAITKSSKVLLSHYKNILSSYNPITEEWKNLVHRDNIDVKGSRVQAVLHMNSFVSLKAIGEKDAKTRTLG